MKKLLIFVGILVAPVVAMASTFNSQQLSTTTPVDGYILQTSKGNNNWVSTTSLGFPSFNVVPTTKGGTGTSTPPTLGQVLVGQGDSTYAPQATSTLGFASLGDLSLYVLKSAFNDLFDTRLSATTSLPNITTLSGLILPLSQVSGVLPAYKGGTGTTTVPTFGQVLVGQGDGTYAPQATSTLGIMGGGSGTTTWNVIGNYLQPASSTWTVGVPNLSSPSGGCVTVNASGVFGTTTCSAGTATTTGPNFGEAQVLFNFNSSTNIPYVANSGQIAALGVVPVGIIAGLNYVGTNNGDGAINGVQYFGTNPNRVSYSSAYRVLQNLVPNKYDLTGNIKITSASFIVTTSGTVQPQVGISVTQAPAVNTINNSLEPDNDGVVWSIYDRPGNDGNIAGTQISPTVTVTPVAGNSHQWTVTITNGQWFMGNSNNQPYTGATTDIIPFIEIAMNNASSGNGYITAVSNATVSGSIVHTLSLQGQATGGGSGTSTPSVGIMGAIQTSDGLGHFLGTSTATVDQNGNASFMGSVSVGTTTYMDASGNTTFNGALSLNSGQVFFPNNLIFYSTSTGIGNSALLLDSDGSGSGGNSTWSWDNLGDLTMGDIYSNVDGSPAINLPGRGHVDIGDPNGLYGFVNLSVDQSRNVRITNLANRNSTLIVSGLSNGASGGYGQIQWNNQNTAYNPVLGLLGDNGNGQYGLMNLFGNTNYNGRIFEFDAQDNALSTNRFVFKESVNKATSTINQYYTSFDIQGTDGAFHGNGLTFWGLGSGAGGQNIGVGINLNFDQRGQHALNALDIGSNLGFTAGYDYAGTVQAPPNGGAIEGSVGIGTSTPQTQLDVNGDITDEAVKGATIVGTDATGKIISVATSSLGITGYWNKSGNTISNTVDNASTTNLKVSGLADIASALVGTIQNTGPYLDSSFNSGTSGQVLTSTVNGTSWRNATPNYWTQSGATTTNTVANLSTTNIFVSGVANIFSAIISSIRNSGQYYDSVGSAGTSGQVLTATATSTLWQTSASTAWSVSGATTTNSVANVASTKGVFGSVNSTSSGNLSTSMNYTVNGINAISRNSNGNWYLAGAPVTSILYGNGNSIIIGPNAGANIIGSSSSLITGIGAGYGDTTLPDYIASNHDTFYGNQAGYNIGNSGGNVLYGYRSGYNINSSGGNILIGGNSGYNIQDSFGNIVLGNGVGIKADTNSHLNIGNLLYGTGIYNGYQLETDTYALSSTPSGGFIGIGTDSPTGTLSVKGTAGSLPFVLSSSTNQVMFEVAQSGDECHWNTVTSKWWVYQYSTSSPTLVPVASSTCF